MDREEPEESGKESREEPRDEPRTEGRPASRQRDRGPGAASGRERPAQERTVVGDHSAAEGYQPGRGTGAGEALRGVLTSEVDPGPRRASDRLDEEEHTGEER